MIRPHFVCAFSSLRENSFFFSLSPKPMHFVLKSQVGKLCFSECIFENLTANSPTATDNQNNALVSLVFLISAKEIQCQRSKNRQKKFGSLTVYWVSPRVPRKPAVNGSCSCSIPKPRQPDCKTFERGEALPNGKILWTSY